MGKPNLLNELDIELAPNTVGELELSAVKRVFQSGKISSGLETIKLENEFSDLVCGRACVAMNSGTAALYSSLKVLGVSAGDEVIVPAFTFVGTANAVALTGATPVFVDIDPQTFCIDPQAVEAAITPRTVAILPVHLFGHPSAMKELMEISSRFDLMVIEDAAQAHLAKLDDKPVGSWGKAAAFSFYATKNMTSGEGGMAVFEDSAAAEKAMAFRNQGINENGEAVSIGNNFRMADINAAIGRSQLSRLVQSTHIRRKNATFLNNELRGVITPPTATGAFHVFHQYTIRVAGFNRDEFAKQLKIRGIASGVYYRKPIHKLIPYERPLELLHTQKACDEVLAIPVHPLLTERELERIVIGVNAVANSGT